nr:colicin immunity domain-containing protein [Cytobacillus firmus]
MIVNKYKRMIEDFLNGKISADEFQSLYLNNFKKWNDKMDENLFEILNGIFEAADCYWHECHPGQETPFEISEKN